MKLLLGFIAWLLIVVLICLFFKGASGVDTPEKQRQDYEEIMRNRK